MEDTILDAIISICKAHHAKEVILFGSRAKGTAAPRSDYDIAVDHIDNFDDLCEDIENIDTLYRIDVIELENCRNHLLLEDIKKYGRKIL